MNSNDNNDILSKLNSEERLKYKIYNSIMWISILSIVIIFIFLLGHYFNNNTPATNRTIGQIAKFSKVFPPLIIGFLIAPILSMFQGDFAPIIECFLIVGFLIMAGTFMKQVEEIESKYKETEDQTKE